MDAPDRSSAGHPPLGPHGDDRRPAAALLEQIAARLSPVRGHMDDARFEALVLDVARFTVRWGETRRPPD